MISILMKRKHQLQRMVQITEQVDQLEVSVVARPTFHDKPWEETQAIFKQDQSYLKTLSGSKEKDPYKQELINKYRPLVEKLLDTHEGNYGNLDVMWCFYMWHFDLGKFEDIHDNFRAAIGAGLESPAHFKVNAHTGFCDYVFKYTHEAHTKGKEYKRDYLLNVVKDLLAGDIATNAPLKVKIFRLVGDWFLEVGNKEKAHNLFELVMILDPKKGGVKTKLKDLKKELGYDNSN